MRLIDADALMKRIEDSARNAGLHQEDYCKINRFVAKTPTIEAEPVRHGKWIEQGDEYIDAYYTCSECKADWFIPDGTPAENSMHYCPVCGAKMDLEG